jgi:hypothetical protein
LDLSKLNSDDAVEFAVAHESSHDFFLGDCLSGCGDDTIMSYEIDQNNPPFLSPTDIDSETSWAVEYDAWEPWIE